VGLIGEEGLADAVGLNSKSTFTYLHLVGRQIEQAEHHGVELPL
jgi:hypothetical protein